MKKIPFKCSYKNISCIHVNTLTNSLDIPCSECTHYDNGIRETGAMPILEWIKKLFKNNQNK